MTSSAAEKASTRKYKSDYSRKLHPTDCERGGMGKTLTEAHKEQVRLGMFKIERPRGTKNGLRKEEDDPSLKRKRESQKRCRERNPGLLKNMHPFEEEGDQHQKEKKEKLTRISKNTEYKIIYTQRWKEKK